jgi:hypothetical protein
MNFRLSNRLQRLQLTRHGLDPLFIYHHDRMSHLASTLWRTTSGEQVVARACGTTSQYHLGAFRHANVVLLCLAAV